MRILLFCLAACACGQTACPEAAKQALLAADRRFDQETATRGLDGWMSHFAPDAAILARGKGEVKGLAALRQHYAPMFAQAGFKLRWTPDHADCGASADLGYTYGHATRESTGKDGKPVTATSNYVTVWRKQPDGVWRVIFDLGN
jgi:ketosteroid isomerase-like protein